MHNQSTDALGITATDTKSPSLQIKMILQTIALLVIVFADMPAARSHCKYAKFTPEHTFCKPQNASCEIYKGGLNDEDKTLIVKLHNDYRSTIALGKESRAGGMPPAADMLEMEWDDELSQVAQKLAEQCKMGHDCSECRKVDRFRVGQNLHQLASSNKRPTEDIIKRGIKNFYEEVADFDRNMMSSFKGSSGKMIGHFTQIVWATSYKVGCGFTEYKGGMRQPFMYYLVCNYGPAGNYLGERIYKEGEPASACSSKSSIPGLCKHES